MAINYPFLLQSATYPPLPITIRDLNIQQMKSGDNRMMVHITYLTKKKKKEYIDKGKTMQGRDYKSY